ncbi:hypothetical protein Pmar_PMAR018447 [Perkinsus marinus ATCC 50983]|uniref:Uncharacterized protein n=1 Tax=Perkinsus marinus (strain ATCC 50983 / TXsc) TaxID=423536 RepID=C5KZU8_PERM5|nr:hypothetical protein Pmar_PMAR018447 [Perkinsus marinus ATCC 50983]EER09806.1 hypothetical protein Pmar_PMAR018447 [Perkinsus marinus ATCC 50983]|eukprot:XP_002778011.1 hypothetical protein Pmar_PMAR018447 [Perkinsus marinus ATCC 50983]
MSINLSCPLVDGSRMAAIRGHRVRLIGKLSGDGNNEGEFHLMAPDGEQILCKSPEGITTPNSGDILVVEVVGTVSGDKEIDLDIPPQVHQGGDIDLPIMAKVIALQHRSHVAHLYEAVQA